jgi:hypothetical protein
MEAKARFPSRARRRSPCHNRVAAVLDQVESLGEESGGADQLPRRCTPRTKRGCCGWRFRWPKRTKPRKITVRSEQRAPAEATSDPEETGSAPQHDAVTA